MVLQEKRPCSPRCSVERDIGEMGEDRRSNSIHINRRVNSMFVIPCVFAVGLIVLSGFTAVNVNDESPEVMDTGFTIYGVYDATMRTRKT